MLTILALLLGAFLHSALWLPILYGTLILPLPSNMQIPSKLFFKKQKEESGNKEIGQNDCGMQQKW
jgi:hypothetical protein